MTTKNLILGAFIAAIVSATPAVAQMNSGAMMAKHDKMKMSKSQMMAMHKCKAMSKPMMMKNKKCASMMKMHKGMM